MIRALYRSQKGRIRIDLKPDEFAAALKDTHGLVWVDFEGEPHPVYAYLVRGRILWYELLPARHLAGDMDGQASFHPGHSCYALDARRHAPVDTTAGMDVSAIY
jgi:hypothetical protein